MRVITGSAKGHNLQIPNDPAVRPVKDIVRQAIFSILEDTLKDSDVLDLFAGSGSLGIEALSRGARFCVFVDLSRICIETIKKNLAHTKLDKRSEVLKSDATVYIANTQRKFDFVFMDAPYHMRRFISILKLSAGVLEKNGIIIYLHSRKKDGEKEFIYDKLEIVDSRNFGDTTVTFLRLKKVGPASFLRSGPPAAQD